MVLETHFTTLSLFPLPAVMTLILGEKGEGLRMNLSSIQNHHFFYTIKYYRIKNLKTTKFSLFPSRIIPAAHLDTSSSRRRRRNHLRKKLQEQVPRINHPCIDKESSNVGGVNNSSSSSSCISSSVVLNPKSFHFDNDIPLPDNTNHQILSTTITTHHLPNLIHISPSPKLVGISSVFCAFLVFIAFTKTTTARHSSSITSSLDKEMLKRKFKARMTKHHHDTSSSLQDSKLQHPPSEMSPPHLDKQQLMNTILSFNSSHFHTKIQQTEINHTSSPINSSDFSELNTGEGKGNSHVSMPEDDTTLPQAVDAKSSNILDTEQLLQKKPTPVSGRIITSVKEARQYLYDKKVVKNQLPEFNQLPNIPKVFDFSGTSNGTNLGDNGNVLIKNTNVEEERVNAKTGEGLERENREKWMEDNFHEFQPIVDKIRGGFTNNYMLAKEKVKEDTDDIVSDLKMLQRDETESEFEWMKDEKLREIVFQVRENELMGRDPFYLMDDQDKALFFKGLEKKVEKENEKLCHLHEYLHSNIENLDYGADGISLYDPPENIIPRWKGTPPATTMSQEFLDDYLHQRKTLFAETLGNSDLVNTDPQDSLQSTNKTVKSKNLSSSKTVIEGSDGSVKPGKKSGKEFWQHTKKWSRGFIDSYNAESDPKTKAVMKDIGKDLDRWITEKEIQDTADIMDKVPDKGKKFFAEKIDKLKTEMKLFGPQAVVSKYSEYGEEEEIDYYWWLDLPFLLCIELYIEGDEDERIGFYSLEMASDLELDPKPHHIIAFEDAGDCKNFCYIINAHMEMLGNGNAFVVPQLPKETYQEAKTNGFNVTVIRKGELKLDVDQTLEEVEEKLAEIGSNIYHDKIMKGRNVDVNSVMKGVFGLNKPPKRSTSKKKLKKPTK